MVDKGEVLPSGGNGEEVRWELTLAGRALAVVCAEYRRALDEARAASVSRPPPWAYNAYYQMVSRPAWR